MLKHALVLATALAAVACGKDKAKDSPKSDPKPGATPATKPVEPEKPAAAAPPLPELAGLFNCHAADPKATNGKPAASKNPWALPFSFGGCPAVPPVYGKADVGMPIAEAAKAAKAKADGG